jgi:hypothetical protein
VIRTRGQHRVQPYGQIAGRVGHYRLDPGDIELAVLDLHTVKIVTVNPGHHEVQAFMQLPSSAFHVAARIRLPIDPDVPHGFSRQQIILESTVITAA